MATSSRPRPVILHIVHSLSPGGTERVLAALTRSVPLSRMEHVVCAIRALGPLAGHFPAEVRLVSLDQHGRNPFLFRRLAWLIDEVRPDVIHARNFGTWTDAVLATWLSPGPRVILGFHGMQEGTTFSPAQRLRARLLGMRRLSVATVSHSSADLLHGGLGFDHDRIVVIPNGVCTDRFRPASAGARAAARARFGASPDEFVVVSTGAFKPVKRHGALLEAFEGLLRRGIKARLILAGFGELERELRWTARQKGLSNQVMFTGWVDDVAECLAAADAYACASRYEGLSSSVLEAMSAGLPCVVTDVSDHQRMFASVEPTCVVPVNDTAAMETKLAELARGTGLRQELGQRGRAVVQARFAFARMVTAYECLYAPGGVEPAVAMSNAVAAL